MIESDKQQASQMSLSSDLLPFAPLRTQPGDHRSQLSLQVDSLTWAQVRHTRPPCALWPPQSPMAITGKMTIGYFIIL